MNEVQQEVLAVLLRTLLERELISKAVYDKSRERILGTFDFPPFFWDHEAGKEDAYGSAENSC